MTGRCNGVPDCSDESDEQNCNPLCSRYFEFACENGRQCLQKMMICDGIRQCDDGSDEDPNYAHCTQTEEFSRTCEPFSFKCWNGVCISMEWKCDGVDDCGDYSDEANCRYPTEAPSCMKYFQFSCQNGKCVPIWWKCDGENDCGDWSDEDGCPGSLPVPHTTEVASSCGPNHFRCNSGGCIVNHWICDSRLRMSTQNETNPFGKSVNSLNVPDEAHQGCEGKEHTTSQTTQPPTPSSSPTCGRMGGS
ncbi:sortilin-related receptor-like [Pristis pectinata]|uniref:sortilin-related receptor-like n=1 Tax=Pristis pectinata TaxID=685728 RepID=UPI00223DD130|nr:sortilin-related receptor-like [Pristis pectinata]